MNHIIDFESNGENTSQKLIDRYSLSHIIHGILFYFIFENISFTKKYSLVLTLVFEILWEWFENTPYIIKKYRANPEFKNYKGDSFLNIIGDVIFTLIGYFIANYSSRISIIIVIILELLLIPFEANFLKLGLGSLLNKHNN